MHCVTLRLIAVAVLLSGVGDYCAFDVADPLAPMSAAGTSGLLSTSANLRMDTASIRHTDGQDDRCICCAAGFTARRVEILVTDVVVSMNPPDILRSTDPQIVRVDPPPRA